jgi:hypothetical protein
MNCDLVWEHEAAAAPAARPAALPTSSPMAGAAGWAPTTAAAPVEGDYVAISFGPAPQPSSGADSRTATGRHFRAPSAFGGTATPATATGVGDVTELAARQAPWSGGPESAASSASSRLPATAAVTPSLASPRPQLALLLGAQSPSPRLRVAAPASSPERGTALGTPPWAHASSSGASAGGCGGGGGGSPPPPALPPVAVAAPSAVSPTTAAGGGGVGSARTPESPAARSCATAKSVKAAAGRRDGGASPLSQATTSMSSSGRRLPSAV